ncbi:hypothetical protein [Rubidibacter lacunae]|nr:hypothetical protein [Rubidibacter lacunae]
MNATPFDIISTSASVIGRLAEPIFIASFTPFSSNGALPRS